MSAPKDMVELGAQAKRRIHAAVLAGARSLRTGPPGPDGYAVHLETAAVEIAELGVAYERERIAQQIRNRLRVIVQGEHNYSRRMELVSLLEYVEAKDATVQMGNGDG